MSRMENWRHSRPAPSRLEEGREVYRLALRTADALDAAGLDLWAGGIRSCLDAHTTLARQQHLVVELVRLKHSNAIRVAGCATEVEQALSRLELGLGQVDVPQQPLYSAVRALADHLELAGGRTWLRRLRAVAFDPDRSPAARVARLGEVVSRMKPGVEGLPEGSGPLVRAVLERLDRHRDQRTVATYLEFALTPPAPSQRTEASSEASTTG